MDTIFVLLRIIWYKHIKSGRRLDMSSELLGDFFEIGILKYEYIPIREKAIQDQEQKRLDAALEEERTRTIKEIMNLMEKSKGDRKTIKILLEEVNSKKSNIR